MANFLTVTPKVAGAANDHVPCNKISLVTSPITHSVAGNTGKVYIGTSAMVRATLAGVIAVLAPGAAVSLTNNVSLNTYAFELWYMDADTAGDGVYGTIETV